MAFWAKKKPEPDSDKKEATGTNLLKKKEEKKGAPPKRIDNLRIAQKLNVSLKSLGTGNEYHFLTKDLSATGMFVLCSDHRRYPFIVQSTLLEATVNLQAHGNDELHELRCLCKIARLVEGTVSGFGVRIVQIAPEQRLVLEQFIAKHGSPENFVPYSGGSEEAQTNASAPIPQQAKAPDPDLKSGEIGTDTPPRSLAHTA
jgi:hypothetical protein